MKKKKKRSKSNIYLNEIFSFTFRERSVAGSERLRKKIKNDNISRHHAYDFVRRIPLTLRSRFQM